MTASDFDATTGHPIFADGDAPDVAQNPTEVAEFAASVGTRPMGTTAERTAYAYARTGLRWRDTTDGCEYEYRSGGWVLINRPPTSYTVTMTGITLGTGGTATGQYRVVDGVVDFWVTVVLGTGAAATGTIYVGLPVSASATFPHMGTFLAIGSSGNRTSGVVGRDTATRAWLLNTANNFLSSTQPWSWAGGHEIRVHGSYPA